MTPPWVTLVIFWDIIAVMWVAVIFSAGASLLEARNRKRTEGE